MILRPSDVQTRNGKLFVACKCKERQYLGAWGAAHLGTCALNTECGHCGRPITIERGATDDE